MPCVHYRFQSKLTHDTLPVDGLHITVRELKQHIMRRERLKLCDLQIYNEQTNEEYTVDRALTPNNTSVPIRRIPAAGLKSTNRRFVRHRAEPSGGSSRTTETLVEANTSEEDKIKAVMYQSSLCFYSSGEAAMKLLGLLPANYVCFRCGIPGHHIKNCPPNGDKGFAPYERIRKSTGIPRSFLMEVDDPDRKGVMMDRSGKYVIPVMNAEAYAIGKKKRPFIPQNLPSSSSSSADPQSSSERGKRSRSRSPVDSHREQKRPRH